MSEPTIAQKKPYEVEVEAGKNYFWCACGLSKNQPFCDSSHKVGTIRPIRFQAETSETVYFCGCKRSGAKPICDDTHLTL